MSRSILILLSGLALGCGGSDLPGRIVNNPDEDFDGDGLTNGEEIDGWIITVNATGYPDDVLADAGSLQRLVVSDPRVADSDGDGLSDLEERDAGTDPTLADTDSDLLTDLEELRRWGTSPTQADTDGDAMPSGAGAPLPRLFDGAELRLTADRDAGADATSPLLADSDGDGYSDHDELTVPDRDPGLAEPPGLRVRLTPDSALDLSIDVTYSGSGTETVSHAASLQVTDSESLRSTTSATAAMSAEASARIRTTVGFTAGCCLNVLDVHFSVEEEYRARATIESMASAGLDRNDQRASTATYADMRERTSSETHTVEGALVQASFELTNPTSRTYEVRGLNVVVLFREAGVLKPLAVLTGDEESFVLAPGETLSDILLRDGDANVERVREMMRSPGRVLVSPASYDLVDITSTPVAFQQEKVLERTARIALRHPDSVERFHLAVNAHRDADGEPTGMNVRQIFAKLGIDAGEETVRNPLTGEDEAALIIDGLTARVHESGADPLRGLDAPGYPTSGGPGPREMAETWVGLIDRGDAGSPELASLLDATLFPGESLEIVRAVDRDRDGLADVEEEIVGTSDGTVDSDADPETGETDGLSDFFEVHEPWTVTVDGLDPYTVYADPTSRDSDGDGLLDGEEYEARTDPRLADTDGDGWSDGSELAAGQSPLVRNPGPDDMILQCRTVKVDGDWMYEVLVDLPPGSAELAGWRRNGSGEAFDIAADETRLEWLIDYPENLGPNPTVYLVDSLGLELTRQCPDPVEAYSRTCWNCPVTVPTVTCNVDARSGAMRVEVEDMGEDLVDLEFRLETDIHWTEETIGMRSPCGLPITLSEPRNFDAVGDVTLHREGGMLGEWRSDTDPLAFDGTIGMLTNMDWAFTGGWRDVSDGIGRDGRGAIPLLGDQFCLPSGVGGDLTPERYDVQLEVRATDVDGNLGGDTCDFAYTTPRSCKAILDDDPSKGDGTYRIDPDGPGGDAAFDVYCDMTTDGGGWTFVRWTQKGRVWGPFTDDLKGSYAYGAATTTWPVASSTPTFSVDFEDLPFTSYLFRTGDQEWDCAMGRSNLHAYQPSGELRNAKLLYADYSGTDGGNLQPAGVAVNVLQRGASFPEEPWVGCAGNHEENTNIHDHDGQFMFYGEGSSVIYTDNLYDKGGLAVFVR